MAAEGLLPGGKRGGVAPAPEPGPVESSPDFESGGTMGDVSQAGSFKESRWLRLVWLKLGAL